MLTRTSRNASAIVSNSIMLAVCLAAGAAVAAAQSTPPPQPAPVPPTERPGPARPPEPTQHVNVRIELTILDQNSPGEPSRKQMTMIVADRQNATLRTGGWVMTKDGRRDVNINVDARPTVLRGKEGSVQVDFGLQYQPTNTSADTGLAQTGLNQRINMILESGRPLLISQAADPSSDRKISVEMKATILK
jgi:glucose/arabinose dehydrogenase